MTDELKSKQRFKLYSDELNRTIECENCEKLIGYCKYESDGWDICVDCYNNKEIIK